PGLIIGIATMFARMSDAAGIGGEVLIQKFGEVMNKFVAWYANFVTTKLQVFLEQGMQIIVSFIQGILQALPQLVETYAQIMTTLITTLTTQLPQIIQTG
ncbi:hypothetical protein ELJ07_32195, partial [Klebsiella pneumoniae]|nr:hypothetical protein [Klebsiella pneumoniae]